MAINKFPELKKKYWGSHFWSRGYFVNTVGKDEKMIKQYIRNQDKVDRLESQGKKTRLINFSKPKKNSENGEGQKPETFSFLGFKHYWKLSRNKKWISSTQDRR